MRRGAPVAERAHPMKVVTAAQMRAMDERAQTEFGIPGDDLMVEAGRAVAAEIIDRFEPCPTVIVCGKGNNAGDGFVIARTLAEFDHPVTVVLIARADELRGSAARAFEALGGIGVPVFPPGEHCERLVSCLEGAGLVVDALLGTGVKGPVTGEFARAISIINDSEAPVVAVDVPSGLRELDPGEDPGPVVQADLTVTIGLPKVALLTMPGWLNAGELVVRPINFPPRILEDNGVSLNFATDLLLRSWLPPRPDESNKGDFGRVGILAGSGPCAGAAILAARAAFRAGAGLITIFTPPELNGVYKTALPEATTCIVPGEGPDGAMGAGAASAVLAGAARMDALVVGPGLGTGDSQATLVREVLAGFGGPAVVDADALTVLARGGLERLEGRGNLVLTPHPGEMARLNAADVESVQRDRIGTAQRFAGRHGVTLLLKGACTVVARPDGQAWLNPGACGALAKGGTGDVLSGVIAGLMAQGAEAWTAALLGAHLHLAAGMALAERGNARSVLAREVADEIPGALTALEFDPAPQNDGEDPPWL